MPTGAHAKSMHEIDALLHTRNAVWNQRERVAAHVFLPTEVERRMIGSNGDHVACSERLPQLRRL